MCVNDELDEVQALFLNDKDEIRSSSRGNQGYVYYVLCAILSRQSLNIICLYIGCHHVLIIMWMSLLFLVTAFQIMTFWL